MTYRGVVASEDHVKQGFYHSKYDPGKGRLSSKVDAPGADAFAIWQSTALE